MDSCFSTLRASSGVSFLTSFSAKATAIDLPLRRSISTSNVCPAIEAPKIVFLSRVMKRYGRRSSPASDGSICAHVRTQGSSIHSGRSSLPPPFLLGLPSFDCCSPTRALLSNSANSVGAPFSASNALKKLLGFIANSFAKLFRSRRARN